MRERTKMRRLVRMDKKFWTRFDRTIDRDLSQKTWTADKLHAAALTLMRTCHFRPGGGPSDHVGVTTLRKEHIAVRGGRVSFSFVGKSGKLNTCLVGAACKRTSAILAALARRDGDLLFQGITANTLRAYSRSLGIRPKDFRTYYANSKLIELLSAEQDTKVLRSRRETQRILRESMDTIASGLNNTPAVTRSSYVFSALWMCYINYPATLLKHLRDARSKSTADKLVYLLRSLDWERILLDHSKREPMLFDGDVPVLIISSAGAESLDLRGVRHIVFLGSTWTSAMENQIVGRAQRFNSHAALPVGKRNVNVWKLHTTDGSSVTADQAMHQMVERKKREASELYRIASKASI